MKKSWKNILIILGILFGLWTFGRLTNMLQWYTETTDTNYPTIRKGEKYFASNLLKPKRLDFIIYIPPSKEFDNEVWTHRLCGLEGDTIEIRNGTLYINNKDIDSKLTLSHYYLIANIELNNIKEIEKTEESYEMKKGEDSVYIILPDRLISSNTIAGEKYNFRETDQDEIIQAIYNQPWNLDHFGPVIVPQGKYFVLGDNRKGSNDSRYTGFINMSNYIGTLIK